MTKLKRLGALLIALCMMLTLCFVISCNKDDGNGDDNSNTDNVTLQTIKENYESNGYSVDVAEASELESLKDMAKEDFGVEVTFTGALEAWIEATEEGAEVYELSTKEEAQAFYDALSDFYEQMSGDAGNLKIKDNRVFFASSDEAYNHAFTKGNGSANTNTNTSTNTNTDTNSGTNIQITVETIISNYESHGYDVDPADEGDLANIKEVSSTRFEIDINPSAAYNFSGSTDNQAQVYVLATPEEADALGNALKNMLGGDTVYEVVGNMALIASNEGVLGQAYTQGDGTGAGGVGGGEVVIKGYAIVVLDDATGEAIAEAFVQYCAKDSTCYQGFTDENGMIINDMFDTNYYVAMVVADGYETFNGQIFFTEEEPVITIKLAAVK